MTAIATPARRKVYVNELVDCYYVPGSGHIIDLVHPDDGLTLYCAHDAAAVAAQYPGAQRMPFDQASAAIDGIFRRPVSEITEAIYWEALECLPPVSWRTVDGVESFKMSERTSGCITSIYAQFQGRYFTLADDISTPADEIARRVRAFMSA